MSVGNVDAGELPPVIFRRWIHSREEDGGGVEVHRPEGFDFPPSFGRDGLELREDGSFVLQVIGPADGTIDVPGTWRLVGRGVVAVELDDSSRPPFSFEILDVTEDVLRVRRRDERPSRQCTPADVERVRAFRSHGRVLVVANGSLPSPGYQARVVQSPIRIFPPQFVVERCPLPGFFPQVITPYTVCAHFPYPSDIDEMTVHHAGGRSTVRIEGCGPELAGYERALGGGDAAPCPEGATEATGFSPNLSFDEAFLDALDSLPPLPPGVPDALERIEVLDVGALFGGIAGFRHLFVRVCRSRTP